MRRACLLVALYVPLGAIAQDPDWEVSYNYIDASYGQLDVDVLDTITLDADGPVLEASGAATEHLHLFVSYAKASSDDLVIAETTYEEMATGIGVNFNVQPASLLIQPSISIFARLGYIDGELAVGPSSISDDGLLRSFGVRFMPGPRAEFRGAVEYVDLDSTRSGFATTIGGDIYLAQRVALRLGYTHYHDEEATSLTTGVRFYYGSD